MSHVHTIYTANLIHLPKQKMRHQRLEMKMMLYHWYALPETFCPHWVFVLRI
jgi:hypothetical protein